MTDLPFKGNTDSMDNLAVTREQFRQDIGELLEYTAQALGGVSGAYTTATVNPNAVTLQGSPVLTAGAEPAAADASLRLANTAWVKRNANSAATTAPSAPTDGQVWVDVGQDPPVIKVWDATNNTWVAAGGNPPDASETVKGVAEIATQTEVNTGTDDTRIVTPLKLKTATSGYVSSASLPLAVASNNLTLGTSKGLHLVGNNLEAEIGNGLRFNGNAIEVYPTGEEVVQFVPVAGNVSDEDNEKWGSAGVSSPGGRRTLSLALPAEANGFVALITFRMEILPNRNESYPSGFNAQRANGIAYCDISGRNARAYTSGNPTQSALEVGGVVAHPGGGNGSYDWRSIYYGIRIDGFNCDKGAGNVSFNFGLKDVSHNKVEIIYNKGCRVALFPFLKA